MNFKILRARNYSPSMVLHFISPTLVPEMSEEQENRVTMRSRNVNYNPAITHRLSFYPFFETLQVD